MPGKIHSNLSRKCDVGRATFAGHVSKSNIEVLGYFLLYLIDCNGLFSFLLQDVSKELLYRFAGNLPPTEGDE